MKVATIARTYDIPYPDVLQLNFVHLENTYKEISNQRAYTFETLLGQVGGFVGKDWMKACLFKTLIYFLLWLIF